MQQEEIELIACDPMATKWWSRDSYSGCLIPKCMLLTTRWYIQRKGYFSLVCECCISVSDEWFSTLTVHHYHPWASKSYRFLDDIPEVVVLRVCSLTINIISFMCLLKMQIVEPYPRPLKYKTLGAEPNICFNKKFLMYLKCERTIAPDQWNQNLQDWDLCIGIQYF